jgi:hypothetical protein
MAEDAVLIEVRSEHQCERDARGEPVPDLPPTGW